MTGAGQAHIDCVERAKYEAVTNALLREVEGLRAALTRISERPKGHHDCDDYSRGYGQCKADMANIADAALSPASGGV